MMKKVILFIYLVLKYIEVREDIFIHQMKQIILYSIKYDKLIILKNTGNILSIKIRFEQGRQIKNVHNANDYLLSDFLESNGYTIL